MNTTIVSLFAIACYCTTTIGQALAIKQNKQFRKSLVLFLGFSGSILQAISLYLLIHEPDGINLGFYNVSSVISWMIINIVLLSSLKKPVESLLIFIAPLAILTIMLTATQEAPKTVIPERNFGMLGHILFSILAYSILTIAAFQAVLLAYQNYKLRHHQLKGILKVFPPLQTMESLLFEFVWAGVILLTASLATGFLFVEDLLAQHLAHKTFLSIFAWLVFATLLWGRHQLGWRGNTAIKWTISGTTLLMLSYFGSKFVLDLVLQGR
ncbi:cytochrome C assembly family protein [Spartinivicinus ruber]|uniref:cytochrome C assembly family protein n=1 Tax=Spartinivicinus ruber TaxID=2683272 RepID=UPI0013D6BE60|nr:cytochrome c biogenesis protein CcsA [Spartinivicinus ruber]